MSDIPNIPALRFGKPYESLDAVDVKHHATGETMAKVSQVNAGIIRKDLGKLKAAREKMKVISSADWLKICSKAGEFFLNQPVPLYPGGPAQTPEQYVVTLSGTSGLPHTLVRNNMKKIHQVFTQMDGILRGLTRGLDLKVFDALIGEQAGSAVSFYPVTQGLGAVLPSNSPGVNSLWLPALPLKIPVLLKPGREEPWTPLRIIMSFLQAGAPEESCSFYPTDHEGAGALLKGCGRVLLFGDESTTAPYLNNPCVSIHGPGRSKVVIGEDEVENWEKHLDVLVESIAANGGRSCVNASVVITPKYGKKIAEALAKRLNEVKPRKPDDPKALLSAFANPKMADWIDTTLEDGLKTAGAEDVTAKQRNSVRKVVQDGATYLHPTLVYCDSWEHPLANREFLFPYASVVEMPQSEVLSKIGPTLVCSGITHDKKFTQELLESPLIGRLNLGAVPTGKVGWDQPHEGNLFEFLYHRRAVQVG